MRIAICDNKIHERDRYFDMLRLMSKKHKIDAEFILYSNCGEMLFRFEDKRFMDILFIEIEMSDMSGIEAAQKMRLLGYKGEIVFLTRKKDKQILLAGYDVGALNYIIRDETPDEKVEEIFLRAKELAEFKKQKYVLFTSGSDWVNIPLNSIRYFEIYRRFVTVYYGAQNFEFYASSLESIENQLAGAGFIRIHRSYLVAIKEIGSITYSSLKTRTGISLPIGRTYYSSVKETLKNSEQILTIS